ncbi:hypothetical protein BGZ95_000416 [Linnemannia exigua]|uniref:Uncharacterized protein n=1 Tax=Linnemannia exigua TaxID=604196 RepID=A0AAD4DAD3_9FUNG|nr:hypothetical protein BGZ95_000416 [Linnemannia exigua]
MKITALFSVLLTATLAATAYTAPATSPSLLSLTSSIDKPSNHGQQTSSSEDSALFDSLVDYDHKAADSLVADYYNAVYGNKTNTSFHQSNLVKRAASSKDIIPFCVAITNNPTRTRIFRNQQSCDQNGWRTLFIFTAHTKEDVRHAPYRVCVVASTSGPDRSVIYSYVNGCYIKGWKTEMIFYMSGITSNDRTVSAVHESSVQWIGGNPDRMVMYPFYEGGKHGWGRPSLISYRSRWRLSTSREISILKSEMSSHGQVHKSISVSSPPNGAIQRCVQNLIQTYQENSVAADTHRNVQGIKNSWFVGESKKDGCRSLAASSIVRLGRITNKGITSVELVVNKKVYAAVSFRGNTPTSATYVRLALQESLRTGKPVPVSVDKKVPEQIVALVSGTVATFGGKSTYTVSIPNA